MAAARRAISASFSPTQTTCAADVTIVPGSRPIASHAVRTRSRPATKSANGANGRFHSAAYAAANRGVRVLPLPPMTIGGPGRCAGFGNAGESTRV